MKAGSTNPDPRKSKAANDRRRVIDAAIACFKQYGPQRTSMTDIAEKAGVSRKTLYRMFEDRPSLVERVLERLFGEMRNKIAARMKKVEGTRNIILEGLLVSVDVALEDELFNEIIQKDTNYRVDQLLIRGNRNILNYMFEYWGPIVRQAKEEGLIRKDLSDQRVLELFMTYHTTLVMRDDLAPSERPEFLRDLLGGVLKTD